MSTDDEIKQTVSDFNVMFGSPQGQRGYEQLASFCYKNTSTFDKDSARKSILNEGMRAVILEIDSWIEYDLSTLEETSETDNVERKENE